MKLLSICLMAIAVLAFYGCTLYDMKKPDKIITESIDFKGYKRTFSYYIPDAVIPSPPLLIVLHKSKSTGLEIRQLLKYRFDELAERNKFIVLYPDGYDGNWNDFRKAPSDSAHIKNIDDTGFIGLLIDRFIQQHQVNAGAVFVCGMSGGGHMAMRLASEIPKKLKAIAPLLSQLPTSDNLRTKEINISVPMLLLSGTKDPISPYEGGEISLFGLFLKQGRVLSVEQSVDSFLNKNNITIKPAVEHFPKNIAGKNIWIEKKVWKESDKPEIRSYIVHNGGHTLPGSRHLPVLIYGNTSDDLSIVDEVVDFFIH